MKNYLLLIPLILGLILIGYSWVSSYPLGINSVDDYVFNNLSFCYWFGMPMTLASMFVIATTSENTIVKWIMTVGIVTVMYSLYYFYSSPPTSDANLFRGLHENFAQTKSLDISSYRHSYYQWPGIFILTYIATSVSGINLANFEFLMFGVVGFLLSTTLFVYSTKSLTKAGFMAVIAFFIVNWGYVNYQFVAYTVALCFLLLLFMIEDERPSSSMTILMLLLLVIVTITHAFVPLFFAIFFLIKWIVSRSKRYGELFFFTFVTYFLYQLTSASFSFANNILFAISRESEVSRTFALIPWSNPIDAIAQNFTVSTIAICAIVSFIGFVILFVKGKLRNHDKAIFLMGGFYLSIGLVFYTLGSRAIAIAFIPISLGAAYFLQSKFGRYFNVVFLVLLILFTSVPLRSTFAKAGLFFQMDQGYASANFFIDNYNWTEQNLIVADYRTTDYIAGRTAYGNAEFSTDPNPLTFESADAIFYDVGLGINMDHYFNRTIEDTLNAGILNVFYDNGYALIILEDKS